MSFKKGFTLIELLVVIAIVGILASAISLSLVQVKAKNRDLQRVTDVRSIQQALTMYEATYSSYPVYDGYLTGSDLVSTALVSEGIISSIPKDPFNDNHDGTTYRYHYFSSDGDDYVIRYYLETNSVKGKSAGENTVSP